MSLYSIYLILFTYSTSHAGFIPDYILYPDFHILVFLSF